MAALIILPGLLLLALGVAYGAYRFAYYSPHKNQNDPYLAPDGHRYTPEDGPTYGLIREMDELPFEPVTIRSRDGLQLFGRYYAVAEGAPLQIQMHGYRGHALRDFCGGSWDCLQWAEYAAQRWPGVPISLAGISMGAATVLMASDLPLPEEVKGIIADCGYSSPRAIIKHVCWSLPKPFRIFYPFTSLSAELFGHFDPDAGSALGAVSNTTLPILLIHGEADGFVPCEMSREIAAACASKVRLETFPGADHGVSYLSDPERYGRIVKEFLERCGGI